MIGRNTGARCIYLDHNATTPCAEEVLEVMWPYMSQEYGNPSSPHAMGKHAYAACCSAREQVADFVNCRSTEIVFTSGATESNNVVLLGIMAGESKRKKIVTTSVEHKSISEPCRDLCSEGIEVIELPVTNDGCVDLDTAATVIDENTALVTVQGANNEVGVLQPIYQLAEIAHAKGALFHCDAAQLLGKAPLMNGFRDLDYASFSAHKMYGPKGIGVLYVRNGIPRNALRPIFSGGGQEGALRPGTLNVPGIVGVGEACRIAQERLPKDISEIGLLRSRFEQLIVKAVPHCRINGSRVDRLPGTSSLCIPGVPGTMLIANVPQLCISDGSACASGAPQPSHVLLSMGLSRDDAECTVRISFGRQNTVTDAEEASAGIADAVEQITRLLSDSSTHDRCGAERIN